MKKKYYINEFDKLKRKSNITENTIIYSEYIAENLEKVNKYSVYIAENLDKNSPINIAREFKYSNSTKDYLQQKEKKITKKNKNSFFKKLLNWKNDI